MLTDVLDRAERGDVDSIAFAISPGVAWTLPLYELAIMTAVDLADRGADAVSLTLVTPEPAPLHLFGPAASEAGRRAAAQPRDRARARPCDRRARRPARARRRPVGRGRRGGGAAAAAGAVDRGPAGRRAGLHPRRPPRARRRRRGVYAAGDATAFPIKQGGLATQQADAVAGALVADLLAGAGGAAVPPGPARPAADRRRAAVPAGRAARRQAVGAEPRDRSAARGGLRARAVVAARQGRRPLPRPLSRHRAAASRSGASRSSTAPRPACARPATTATPRSSSRCCSPRRTSGPGTSPRRSTPWTPPRRSAAACSRPPRRGAATPCAPGSRGATTRSPPRVRAARHGGRRGRTDGSSVDVHPPSIREPP